MSLSGKEELTKSSVGVASEEDLFEVGGSLGAEEEEAAGPVLEVALVLHLVDGELVVHYHVRHQLTCSNITQSKNIRLTFEETKKSV